MFIDIHDVGHGACSVVTSSTGRKIMIDAGYCKNPYWFPSVHYCGQRMEMLFAQNLDNDHISNIEGVLQNLSIQSFRTNPSITAEAFLRMKATHGLNDSLRQVYWLLKVGGGNYGPLPAMDEVWLHTFWHPYGRFTETNDLSAPLFVGARGFSILFGGDLEEKGWEAHLLNPFFLAKLRDIRILVASHHGRDNGCCEALFKHCSPEIVIISDYEHRYLSQNTTSWYAYRVSGIPDYTLRQSGFVIPRRYVLTTRSDGNLQIQVRPDGSYTIWPYSHVDRATCNSVTAIAG